MSELDRLQKLWDDICSQKIYNGDGQAAMVVWDHSVRIVFGEATTRDWTHLSCTINGTMVFVAPPGIIPPSLYILKAHKSEVAKARALADIQRAAAEAMMNLARAKFK